ncbi:FG-GAP-like repeat-containing protein [Planomonospora venezuelensis]|uniref:FG-GAP repeat-containing protein n=1 Tax=Planomonospora venezuelensis TaxID=1999 RepID=A0A841D1E9_PLAVE|nr:FG-GAP-like repeat-containing protein [Planomonospora venezuelensis]MBB5962228.1 hypothetical protein [Planomonospora venezuelensis]
MHAEKITRAAVLLALVAALGGAAVPAQAATAAPPNSDFNGDGYNDLAVGSPHYPGYAGGETSGMVAVLYGGPNGLNGRHILRPQAGCIGGDHYGQPQPCSWWGRSLAAADVDADGRADLLHAGLYDMEVRSWKPLGITAIERRTHIPNHSAGLAGGQFDDRPGTDIVIGSKPGYGGRIGGWYNRSASYISQAMENGSHSQIEAAGFGDINGDGRMEAVVVAEKYMIGTGGKEAFLWLLEDLHRSPLKLTELGAQATCTLPPSFGRGCPMRDSKVAVGNVNGDGHPDVVMITPGAASLQVWYGSAAGLRRDPGYTADLSWLAPGAEIGPGLAVGDVDGDGFAEIAVGASKVAVSGHDEAGAIAVIPGSANGPVLKHSKIITQDGVGSTGDGIPGTPPPAATPAPDPGRTPVPEPTWDPQPTGTPEPVAGPLPDPISEQSQAGDHFGEAVTIIDVTGDGKGEVIVGAPAKNGGAGMLTVLRGSGTGVATADAQIVHPRPVGVTYPQAAFGLVLLR